MPSLHPPLIRSQMVPIFLRHAHGVGYDSSALIRRCQLPTDASARSEIEVPVSALRLVGDELAHTLEDPLLGAHLACAIPRGSYGLAEFAIRNAPTVREVCLRMSRYSALLDRLTICTFDEDRDEPSITLRVSGEPECLGWQGNELVITFMARIFEEAFPGRRVIRGAWFAHRCAGHRRKLAALIGTTRLDFDRGSNGLRLDARALLHPSPGADAALLKVLDDQATRIAAEEGPPLDPIGQVREQVRRCLGVERPDLWRVARALGTSPRSLQRVLADQQTSFQVLLDDVRRGLALRYLAEDARKIDDVAFRLGYSDPAAFVRAFRRWTGSSPGRYRARGATRGAAGPGSRPRG